MATTSTINTNYAGIDSRHYWASTFKSTDTLDKGAVTVMDNIKFKSNLHRLDITNATGNFTCDFTAGGAVDLSDKVLEPKRLSTQFEVCKSDYVSAWDSDSMGAGAESDSLPNDVQENFLIQVLAEIAQEVDFNMWQGESGNAGEFQGFLPTIDADTGVTVVTAITVTSANVIEELGKIYDAIPDQMIEKDDLKWVVSVNIARAYKRALSAAGFRLDYSVGDKPLDYEGLELISIGGLPANTSVVYQKPNMVVGFSLESEFQEIKVLDMSDVDLSDNVRIKLSYAADTNFIVPEDIIFYQA